MEQRKFFRLSSVNKYFRPFHSNLLNAIQYNFPTLSLTHNLEKVLMARCESNLGTGSRRDKYIISHSQRAPFFCLGDDDDNCARRSLPSLFLFSLLRSRALFWTIALSIPLKTFNGAILKRKLTFN